MSEKWKWNPDEYEDLGISLGRFWYKVFKGNELWANVFTKGTIGIIFVFVLVVIGILQGNLLILFISIPLVMVSHIVFGALVKNIGNIQLGKINLLVEDICRYGLLGLGGIIQLIWF